MFTNSYGDFYAGIGADSGSAIPLEDYDYGAFS